MASQSDIDGLVKRLVERDRKALSKAITLIESKGIQQKELARTLVKSLPPPPKSTLRIAISGAPGVGKSTFIEALGIELIGLGHHPAILTIDPTSHISGGSILGDRTRMEELSKQKEAFIRQSPSANFLGGVSRRTRETIFVCESAGHDVIIVETVGVGQSEYLAADLTDIFVLLIQPGSGDELQGVKKGVMEMADILVVTKADGSLEESARTSLRHLKNATHILQPKFHGLSRKVCQVSAINNSGLMAFWNQLNNLHQALQEKSAIDDQRKRQMLNWLSDVVDETWLDLIHTDDKASGLMSSARRKVLEGESHVYDAAMDMIKNRISTL